MRVLVIGLDSVPPELFFGRCLAEMPFVRSLIPKSSWGPLLSCDPPITVPAWRVMASGRTPQELGVYGFRHRKPGDDYRQVRIATSLDFSSPAIWDVLAERGKKVCLVGVPPSYPPFPVNGSLVSCFLAPQNNGAFTYPEALGLEIKRWYGNYLSDVEFRTDRREQIREQAFEMTRQKFDLTKRLLAREPWDFAMMVDIGPDRMHHAFWKFCDPGHPKYRKGNPHETVLKDYYRFLDGQIGALVESVRSESTAVYIVSDHGSKAMKGCFCVNEWLFQKGYLALREYPERVAPLEECRVDWSRTTAWGWGGYYARIFVNLGGREPEGCVAPEQHAGVLARLRADLSEIETPEGGLLPVRAVQSGEGWNGNPSDLMVYFADLDYRSAGTLGHRKLFLDENDTGPDGAVHSMRGICLRIPAAVKIPGRIEDVFGFWLMDLGLGKE